MDCTAVGIEPGICYGDKKNHIKTNYNDIKNWKNSKELFVDSIATGDKIVKDGRAIKEIFNCNYVDMESYAIAKVCEKYSNACKEHNTDQILENIDKSF